MQSISGGTTSSAASLLGHPNLPVCAGELQSKSLSYDVDAFLPDGSSAGVGAIGELLCRGPFLRVPWASSETTTGRAFTRPTSPITTGV
ncbi:MAG: hypothetical protein IPG50_20680 [Myxococcales bacterium]|nr:hypothetical protein [Myxococcales bacterium]